MLTVARMIAQIRRAVVGDDGLQFMGWKGFLERFEIYVPKIGRTRAKQVAFGEGKSQSWTCMFRTSFCFSPLEILSTSTDERPNFMQAAIVQFHRE